MSPTPSEDKTASIAEAMAQVMRAVSHVAKRDQNTQQGFSFRGIDAVVNAVGPALRDAGVIVLPKVQSVTASTVEVGQRRTPMGHVAVVVRYRFVGPAGDYLDATTPGEAMDSGDKATAKAMSVAFRTALLQALALPTDDPDPDSQTYERSPAPAPDPMLALRIEVADAAKAAGVALSEIGDQYAADHEGASISTSTDADYLTNLRDELRARVA